MDSLKLSLISSAVALVLSSHVSADDNIEHIEVSASRIQTKLNELPISVSVLTKQDIEQLNANSLSELLRYQPGVTVERSSDRHGDANINIRGIGGNRILMVRDGAAMPDGFGSAGTSQGRGSFDPFNLEQVEILKGPASALYGSNALGGVVVFNTASAQNLVEKNGGNNYLSVNAGYFSVDNRSRVGVVAATKVDEHYLLVDVQRQDFNETEINSDFTPNPKQAHTNSLLAKWQYEGIDQQSIGVIVDYFKQSAEHQLNTNLGPISGPPGSAISKASAEDESLRYRVGIKHELLDVAGLDQIKWQLDYQYSNYQQYELEQTDNPGSSMPPVPVSSIQDQEWEDFEQKQINLSVLAQKQWHEHQLLFGLDYLGKNVTRPIGRLQTDLISGDSTNVINGYVHPGKTFPDADITQIGAFVQDYYDVSDSLTLVAGLRYDRFENTPNTDAAYENFNVSNATPKGNSDSAWSPHLGLVYKLLGGVSVFANVTTGFRAPPVAEQYISRAILIPVPGVPHEVVPNNDLGSETSQGLELGMRWNNHLARIEVSVYQNDYDDFIDSQTIGYRDIPPVFVGDTAVRQIQYQNLDKVRIRGAEFSGHLLLDRLLPSGWSGDAHFAMSFIDGENLNTGTGLNSVPPHSGVIGISLSPSDDWRFSWNMRAVAKASDVEPVSMHGREMPAFEPPGYTVHDIGLRYHFDDDLALSANVYNLANKKYWDAHNKGANAAGNLDASVAPGRNTSLNLHYKF